MMLTASATLALLFHGIAAQSTSGVSTGTPTVTVATAIPSASAPLDQQLPSQAALPPKQAWCPSDIFCAGAVSDVAKDESDKSRADRAVIILLTHSCFKPSTSPIFTPTTRLSRTRYTIFMVFLALETLIIMTSKANEQEPTRSSQRLPKHLVGHHLRTGGELC